MPEEGRFQAWINPLAFLDVDLPAALTQNPKPMAESILAFLCSPGIAADTASLVDRYRRISTEPIRLSVAPAEPRILEKLIWPLRHAKASYVVGNYLGVVALCGMVSEMVALLLWQVTDASLNGRPMTPADEPALFGSSFERLGQDRRVHVLRAYGVINNDVVTMFDTIRLIRRRYLHLWSQDHDRLPDDAVASVHAAVGLVVAAVGQDFADGKVVLNPRLVKYLGRQGVYEPVEEPAV